MTMEYSANDPSRMDADGNSQNYANGMECIVALEQLFGTYMTAMFCFMNVVRYGWRFGNKDVPLEHEAKKKKWYRNMGNHLLEKHKAGNGIQGVDYKDWVLPKDFKGQ